MVCRMVALKKHKFPELISPRGRSSFTCKTACPFGALFKSSSNNFEVSSPLPFFKALFKLSVPEASEVRFASWFTLPFPSSSATELIWCSLTLFALVILEGLGEKLVKLPFTFTISWALGETEASDETPEPDSISLRMPPTPRRNNVLAPREDPLAHVERSRIKPVYVDMPREACPPPELLVEIREAACATSP